MRYWTNYDKDIFNELIAIVNRDDINDLPIVTENNWFDSLNKWVNNLVETRIINYELKDIDILRKINTEIENKEEDERFSLLVVYGRILIKGKVKFSEGDQEQKPLLDTGLVKKRYSKDGYYIEVSNPIYWFIFNEVYINKMLPNTRGYGRKLGMWLITQDAQHLLSVEEVNNIIDSLANQNLSENENRFLIESQINSI
jgi:hypothetical protein